MPKVQTHSESTFPILPTPIPNYIPDTSHGEQPDGWIRSWKDPFYRNYAAYWLHLASEIQERLSRNVKKGGERPFRPEDVRTLLQDFRLLARNAEKYITALDKGNKRDAQRRALLLGDQVRKMEKTERLSNLKANEISHEQSVTRSEEYRSFVKKRLKEATLIHALRTIQEWNPAFHENTVRHFSQWLSDTSHQSRIFWIHGEPGCGKSVITYYFARKCFSHNALAASYHFSKTSTKEVILGTFLATIVTDFEMYLGTAFTWKVASVVSELHPIAQQELFTWPLQTQFNQVLLPAYQRLSPSERKPLLVVLDDIDKCEDRGAKEVFELIQAALETLPICFLISCYKNPVIEYFLRGVLSAQVYTHPVPFYANPNKNKTPTASSFTIPTDPDSWENASPPMTPLPDLYPASDDDSENDT